jgi:hypothetical protein
MEDLQSLYTSEVSPDSGSVVEEHSVAPLEVDALEGENAQEVDDFRRLSQVKSVNPTEESVCATSEDVIDVPPTLAVETVEMMSIPNTEMSSEIHAPDLGVAAKSIIEVGVHSMAEQLAAPADDVDSNTFTSQELTIEPKFGADILPEINLNDGSDRRLSNNRTNEMVIDPDHDTGSVEDNTVRSSFAVIEQHANSESFELDVTPPLEDSVSSETMRDVNENNKDGSIIEQPPVDALETSPDVTNTAGDEAIENLDLIERKSATGASATEKYSDATEANDTVNQAVADIIGEESSELYESFTPIESHLRRLSHATRFRPKPRWNSSSTLSLALRGVQNRQQPVPAVEVSISFAEEDHEVRVVEETVVEEAESVKASETGTTGAEDLSAPPLDIRRDASDTSENVEPGVTMVEVPIPSASEQILADLPEQHSISVSMDLELPQEIDAHETLETLTQLEKCFELVDDEGSLQRQSMSASVALVNEDQLTDDVHLTEDINAIINAANTSGLVSTRGSVLQTRESSRRVSFNIPENKDTLPTKANVPEVEEKPPTPVEVLEEESEEIEILSDNSEQEINSFENLPVTPDISASRIPTLHFRPDWKIEFREVDCEGSLIPIYSSRKKRVSLPSLPPITYTPKPETIKRDSTKKRVVLPKTAPEPKAKPLNLLLTRDGLFFQGYFTLTIVAAPTNTKKDKSQEIMFFQEASRDPVGACLPSLET